MFRDLLRLWKYVRKYKGRLISGIVLFLFARCCEVSIPMFLGVGIDRLTTGQGDLLYPICGIFAAAVLRFFIVTSARIAVRRASFLVQRDLRNVFYQHLQRMGPNFFARFAVGDLMTRAIADIQLVRRLIGNGTTMVVIFVYATLFGFGCMFYLSPQLLLVVLPPLPIVLIYAWRTSSKLGIASRRVQEKLADLGSHVQENLTGIRTIQAMAQEENEQRRFAEHSQAYSDKFFDHARIHSLMQSIMPSLAAVSIIGILGYGGHLVLTEQLTVGAFAVYFFYVNMIVQPFRVAGMIISLIQRGAVASQRLHQVLDYEPEIKDSPIDEVPEVIRGEIKIHNLTYAYPHSAQPSLVDINLTIARGESIAIMGRIGCGKTTLLKQLVRILDTPTAAVYFDGYDVRDYPLQQLRTQVAFVPQDTFLFAEPMRSNITYDQPRRSIDQVWQAADAASLSDTVEAMERKMETIVGERGVTLSGGQKQRTTVARGVIRHAPVLVLDDCFASVDTETEDYILQSLRKLRVDQTTILVSHRVSTAKHADRILIMDQGRIVEVGTHEELIRLNGRYADLERMQREGAEFDYFSHQRSVGTLK